MSKQVISIIGPIGSFNMGGQDVIGVQLLDVVGMVSKLPADTTELQINVAGPGGRKDVGDNIYNFLVSLKQRMKIHTMQVGDIGSIMTKIFLAGDKRTALIGTNPETLEPYEFFIHNPWTSVTGDSNTLQARLDAIKQEEDELTSFYMSFMGLTKEAIQPLMAAETGMDAAKALELKFATDTIEALNIAAYMENKPKTVGEKLDALILVMENYFKGKQPTMAMIVELEGTVPKISVATEDATKMQGVAAMLVDANGAATTTPVPDGTYNSKDGKMKITIAGGKVATVENAVAAPTPTPAPEPVVDKTMAAKLDSLIGLIGKMVEVDQNKTKEDEIKAAVTLALEEERKKQKTKHVPTIKVMRDGKEVIEPKESPIAAMNKKNLQKV